MALPKRWLVVGKVLLLFYIYLVISVDGNISKDDGHHPTTVTFSTCQTTTDDEFLSNSSTVNADRHASVDVDMATICSANESSNRHAQFCGTLSDVAKYLCEKNITTFKVKATATASKCPDAAQLRELTAGHHLQLAVNVSWLLQLNSNNITNCTEFCGNSSRYVTTVACNAVLVGIQIILKTESSMSHAPKGSLIKLNDIDKNNTSLNSTKTSDVHSDVSRVKPVPSTTEKPLEASSATVGAEKLNVTLSHIPTTVIKPTSVATEATTATKGRTKPTSQPMTMTPTTTKMMTKMMMTESANSTSTTAKATVQTTVELSTLKVVGKMEAVEPDNAGGEDDLEVDAEQEPPTGVQQEAGNKNDKIDESYGDDDGEQEVEKQKLEAALNAIDVEFGDRLDARPKGHAIGTFSSGYADDADSHFFVYFLSVVVLCIAMYLLFHNKQKILAIIVEGRQDRRRRPNSNLYRKLDNNLEEVIQDRPKNGRSNVIY